MINAPAVAIVPATWWYKKYSLPVALMLVWIFISTGFYIRETTNREASEQEIRAASEAAIASFKKDVVAFRKELEDVASVKKDIEAIRKAVERIEKKGKK